MKTLLHTLILSIVALTSHAQQDSTTIWVNTHNGNIYTLDVHNGCAAQLYCSTGKEYIMDIAHTPNGNLYGNTEDTLYRIYPNGLMSPIGKIPPSAALVGLNDSILFISSAQNLLSVNVHNAAIKQIGYLGYTADGDLTWMGDKLYLVAQSFLLAITFDNSFNEIQIVDTVMLDSSTFYTPALATTFIDTSGYTLIAFPGNIEVYKVDTSTGSYHQICVNYTTVPVFGASTLIFPLKKFTNSINKTPILNSINIFPNPAHDLIFIEANGFTGKYNELEILCYDIFGRLRRREFLNSSKSQIDISTLSSGAYFLNIKYNGELLHSKKIVIK